MAVPQDQQRRLKVFISYATENRPIAETIFERLRSEGFDPWYDQLLLPGQRWEAEIEANQKAADIVIIILSNESVVKRGFVQREAIAAVRRLDDMLPNDIYIIPVRIDDCTPPDQISGKIQFIDWKRDDAWIRIKASLRSAASARGLRIGEEVELGPFRYRTAELHEITAGSRPYQHSIEHPEFQSATLPEVATQLTAYFSARATQSIIDQRTAQWHADLEDSFDSEQSSFSHRTYRVVHASSKMISILASTHYFFVGAAHGNQHFDAYNFRISNNQIIPFKLPDATDYGRDTLKLISNLSIDKLKREYWEKTGREIEQEDVDEWFNAGAGEVWENFVNFTITPNGIGLHFAPYQVHAYVFGAWNIEIPFFELRACASFSVLADLAKLDD